MSALIYQPGDLRPGDIFLGPIGGLVGLGVGLGQLALGEGFRLGKLSIRHAGIITHVDSMGVLLAQAMPGGAEIVPIERDEHWTERCAYVRLPEDYPGQAQDAAAVARAMVKAGVGYSYASYLSLGLYRFGVRHDRLLSYINRRQEPIRLDDFGPNDWPTQVRLPREAICSVFVDQAWTLAGKKVVQDVRPQAVTPGMLAETLISFPGTVWCRPRGEHLPAVTWQV